MSRLLARILFFIPVLMIGLSLLNTTGDTASLPKPAQDYLNWYLNQPLDLRHWIANRVAAAGIIGLVFSTFGLMLFWSPARYFYIASVVVMLLGNVSDLPILETSYQLIIDDILCIFVGLNTSLIFLTSACPYFLPDKNPRKS